MYDNENLYYPFTYLNMLNLCLKNVQKIHLLNF